MGYGEPVSLCTTTLLKPIVFDFLVFRKKEKGKREINSFKLLERFLDTETENSVIVNFVLLDR